MASTASSSSSSSVEPSKPSIAQDVYDGTASLGRFWAFFTAIIVTILGLGGVIAGIYMLLRRVTERTKIAAKITAVNGQSSGNCISTPANQVSCTLTISFPWQGQELTSTINYEGTTPYAVGQQLIIYVNNNDSNDIALSPDTSRGFGWAVIIVSVISVIMAWFMVWATRKWKILAAGQGVGAVWNLVR